MKEGTFQKCISIVLFLLLILFFTKDNHLFTTHFYQHIKEVKYPEEITVLVNKNYKLDPSYVPPDLEEIGLDYAKEDKRLRREAKNQWEQLSRDASLLGYQVIVTSAYRGYDYQEGLYQYYVDTKGIDSADLCSARPGHSEHQTGLSIDVMGSNQDYSLFAESKEFTWMITHAHEYGFILRYPLGKEKITGFQYEPWHYRYVGVEAATIIYQNNWTLEEYLQKRK